MKARAALLALALLAAGCSGSDASDTADEVAEDPEVTASTTTTTTTTTSTTTTMASTTTTTPQGSVARTVKVGDDMRSYLLFVPVTLDPATPAPLVVNLHGATEEERIQEQRGFNGTAEGEGVVVVYPDAVDGVWDLSGTSDVEFIGEIIDEVSASTAIDQDRVYAIGFSQGGAFSTFLSCRLPDRFTAVASVASLLHHDAPACPSHSPARVLAFAGETDRIYSIEEGLLFPSTDPDTPGPLSDETDAWATTNGCESDPDEESLPEGVVRRIHDCADGSALTVYVHPGAHIWPRGDFGLDANAIIWEFLEQYAAPLPPG